MLISLNKVQIDEILSSLKEGSPTKDHILKEMEGSSKTIAKEFCDLFPSVRLPSGKYFKSNVTDVAKRLKLFQQEYKYSAETILEAARRYVDNAIQANYEYVRTAAYFIYKKGEGSDLADWCEEVEQEGTSEPNYRLL